MIELSDRTKTEAETAATLNPKVRNRAYMMAMDFLRSKKYSQAFQSFIEVRSRYVPRIGDEIIFFFTLTLLYGSEGIDQQMTEQYVDKLAKVDRGVSPLRGPASPFGYRLPDQVPF